MKFIAWVTPRCFVETDINAISLLSKTFNIDWYIIDSDLCDEFSEQIAHLAQEGVNVQEMVLPGKNRSLKVLLFYCKLLRNIKCKHYDLIYNAIFGMPFYMPLEAMILHGEKIVIALHNVTTPKGAKAASLPSKLYTYFVSHSFTNYHTFSISQCNILNGIVKGRNIFQIPFLLKDYGQSLASQPSIVTFLFFGQILAYKRLDILIKAAENVFTRTNIPFKVKIAGSCPYWNKYAKLIIHKELFDLTIRRIANKEIPDLFATSHYFVMPYQDIAQSGAIIVSINYGIPVIASKLPAFEEYIENGKNGYIISPANQEDLELLITDILANHKKNYPLLKAGIIKTREYNFSDEVIKQKYITEFGHIINSLQ